MENSKDKGTAYLYSFPFWLYLDPVSLPEVKNFYLGNHLIWLYPPFRSGAANFTTMPEINPQNIPFLPGKRPDIGPELRVHSQVLIPDIAKREGGRPVMMLVTGQEWGNLTRNPPMDSLRVDVSGSAYTHQIADEVVQKLIQLLRWRSRQWWMGRSIDAWLGYRRCTFPVSKDGVPLAGPQALAQINVIGTHILTIAGDERPIDRDMWEIVIEDILKENNAPSHINYLFDARYFAFKGDLRRAVFDMVVACEQVRDLAYKKFGKKARGTDLITHLSKDLSKISGHSYEVEYPSDYQLIKKLWIARGNIAHGRQATLDNLSIFQFLQAVEHCVRWLEHLEGTQPNNAFNPMP